ncbi:hypothetical protein L1D37_13605 [Vibrio sp. Isolate33]|uniref:hypothetical protein n=1 Tax=Vibrio sp. Isolate33 TaxID=2908539 RepID=UPI001EFC3F38|nr:hypothetical protein [Vibrio sp. Isolate33]MCG9544802.1 hypothetical protein [Vibrio sp. Isolate33]
MRIIRNALLIMFMTLSGYAHAIDCPLGEVDKSGVCTSVCEVLKSQSRTYTYDAYIWGESPTSACIGQYGSACVLNSGSISVSVDPTKRMWSNSFTFTGQKCSRGDSFSGDSAKPFPWEGDANMNGILDSEEDWDGDGIPNHSDANPDTNDNVVADTDEDGIPDRIQSDYDKLIELKEIKNYNCVGGLDCMNTRAWSNSVRELAGNQNDLIGVIDKLVRTGINRNQFNEALNYYNGGLNKTIVNGIVAIRQDIMFNNQLVVKNHAEITGLGTVLRNETSKMKRNLDEFVTDLSPKFTNLETMMNDNAYNVWQVKNNTSENLTLSNRIFERISNLDNSEAILSATNQQQLRNAAKAHANQKILKRMEKSQKEMTTNVSGLSEQVTAVDGKLDSLDTQLSALSSQIDGIDGGGDYGDTINAIGANINDLKNGLLSGNTFNVPTSDFNGSGFLISEKATKQVTDDIDSLRTELSTQMDLFKNILSFDTESFNDGQYQEHVLDLNIDGQSHSFKTGVLSALLDNAEIIKAVILFMFVLMGIRMLGGE